MAKIRAGLCGMKGFLLNGFRADFESYKSIFIDTVDLLRLLILLGKEN